MARQLRFFANRNNSYGGGGGNNQSGQREYFNYDEKEDPLQIERTDFDNYRILGLRPNATVEQIKENFRELARKYHPDSLSQEIPHTPTAQQKHLHQLKGGQHAQLPRKIGSSEKMSEKQKQHNLQQFLIIKQAYDSLMKKIQTEETMRSKRRQQELENW